MIPKRIILHHSLTVDSGTVSWGAIRAYHTIERDWSDIGYHAGCELIDDRYECLYGRPATTQGAHTKGANHDSLGFCFVGNYDQEPPPHQMQYVAIQRVIAPWINQFQIDIDRIYAHHAFAPHKSCPGYAFDLEEFKGLITTIIAQP